MPILSAQDLFINAVTLDRPRAMRTALSTLHPSTSLYRSAALLPAESVIMDPEDIDPRPLTTRQIDGAALSYRLPPFYTADWLRLDMQMLADRVQYRRAKALRLLTNATGPRDVDLFFSWIYGAKEVLAAWTVEDASGEIRLVRRSCDVEAGDGDPLRFMWRHEWTIPIDCVGFFTRFFKDIRS